MSYKFIKSNEENPQKVIIQINKKYQEGIYFKLFQIQKRVEKREGFTNQKRKGNFTELIETYYHEGTSRNMDPDLYQKCYGSPKINQLVEHIIKNLEDISF
jgi:hypothetical protein